MFRRKGKYMLAIINLAENQLGKDWTCCCPEMGYSYRIEWCACFVSWLGVKTNANTPVNMSCTKQIEEFKRRGQYKYKTEVPKAGYWVYYSWKVNNDPDHVGIIESVNGQYITVIEGNNGIYPDDRVRRRTIKYSDPQVMGWAAPDYASPSKPTGDISVPVYSGANPTIAWDYKYDQKIEELQKILNDKGYKLEIDGISGPDTYKAVSKYTIELYDMGPLTKWTQDRLNEMGFNCGEADGYAEPPTMSGIADFQKKYKLGVGYLGGTDWYYVLR